MRNIQHIPSPANHPNLRSLSLQKPLRPSHQTLHTFRPNPTNSNLPSTPMSVKDIDEEIQKLKQQYQSLTNKSPDMGVQRKETHSASPDKVLRRCKNLKSLASFVPDQVIDTKNQNPYCSNSNNPTLSSINYLKPYKLQAEEKTARVSESTGTVHSSGYRDSSIYRTSTEESQKQVSIFSQTRTTNFKQSIGYSPGILEYMRANPHPPIDFSPDRAIRTEQNIKSKKDPQIEILKTTKPNPELISIKQSAEILQQSVEADQDKGFQVLNTHQRSVTTKYQERFSTKSMDGIPNLKGDNRGLIQAINEKNKQIVLVENKVARLENELQESKEAIQRKKFEIRNMKESHKMAMDINTKTVNRLKRDIQLNDSKRSTSKTDLDSKFHKVNLENQQLSSTNNNLLKQITNLKKELAKRKESDNIQQEMYSVLKVKIAEKTSMVIELQKSLDRISEQNSTLRKRLTERLNESNKQSALVIHSFNNDKNQALNSILKTNEQENARYKNNLSLKDEEIHRLEEVNRELRGVVESLKNDVEIEKLKRMTEVKNVQTTFKIEEQVKDNEIHSLNRTLRSLEEKLKYIVQEDRKKDQFMVEYLRGRVETGEEKLHIDNFFKKFELLSVNTNIVECLKREQAEIDTLKTEVRKLLPKR